MSKALVTILMFGGLLLFITSPFAAFASLMLFLLVAAFLWTVWTVVQAVAGGGDIKDLP
jgi:hypothetical protein